MNEVKKELAIEASILYYEKNHSQNQIAQELDISRSYVSQLLSYARETGLVQIQVHIQKSNERDLKKEIEWKQRYKKARKIYILNSEDEKESDQRMGKFVAPFATEWMNRSKIIGVNLGHSIEKVIREIDPGKIQEGESKKVVQTMGGFSYNRIDHSSHPNEVVRKVESLVVL
ncbi:MAG TPA: hypothetical protein DHN33_06460 [Eubacteriaceae bacterium]|nr:hypothetical protein [Eubacteriaceae bacterium]